MLSHCSGLSHAVIRQLRVGNQHKMGPSGTRALLLENHTQHFNVIHLQYLEAFLEWQLGVQQHTTQTNLDSHIEWTTCHLGDFWDKDGNNGFIPSEKYLTAMMNRAIEQDQSDADQHTAVTPSSLLAINDSHKV